MDVNGSLVFDASAASEIKKLRIEKVASNPAIVASDVGRLIYNTATKQLLIGLNSTGSTYVWDVIATAAATDITALQAEVDAIETSMGLTATGTFDATKFTGNLAGKTSYVDLITSLQTLVATAQTTAGNALPKAGGKMTGAINEAALGTVAVAATMDIGAVNANTINVTGSGSVTSLGPIAAGAVRTLIFPAGVILFHGVNIFLPSAKNITTEAGDVGEFTSTAVGGWTCTNYIRASGLPLESASNLTSTLRLTGSASALAMTAMNIVEPSRVIASAPVANYDLFTSQGSVHFHTVAATANWIDRITHSGTTTLNTVMAIGDTITVAHVTTQGATAFFLTAIQVDGVATPIKWQGGTVPAAGNVSGNDVYTFTLIKTAAATFTVLGSLTQYK